MKVPGFSMVFVRFNHTGMVDIAPHFIVPPWIIRAIPMMKNAVCETNTTLGIPLCCVLAQMCGSLPLG